MESKLLFILARVYSTESHAHCDAMFDVTVTLAHSNALSFR